MWQTGMYVSCGNGPTLHLLIIISVGRYRKAELGKPVILSRLPTHSTRFPARNTAWFARNSDDSKFIIEHAFRSGYKDYNGITYESKTHYV